MCIGSFNESVGAATSPSTGGGGDEMSTKLSSEPDSSPLSSLDVRLHGGIRIDVQSSRAERLFSDVVLTL